MSTYLFCLLDKERYGRSIKEASQFLRRRASISGPEALYSRVRFTRVDQLRVLDSRMSRDDLYQKHCFEDKSFVYVEPEEEEVVSAVNRKQQLQPVWKSTSVSGAPDNSSLSHFSAMTRPTWLGRAARNRHRHAIEHGVEDDAMIQDECAVKF